MHAALKLLSLTHVLTKHLRQVTGLMASSHSLVPLCMFNFYPLTILQGDHFDVGQSADLADPPVISSGLILSGNFGLSGT